MSIANFQLKIYDVEDDLAYTIDDEILNCSFTDVFTTDVGSFVFALPAMKGFSNLYDDIGNYYKVEIYTGYDGVFNHLFTGRITDFTTQTGKETRRVFEGKGLGEVLERNFKRNKRWQEVAADDIVAELASDLSLDTDIDADTTTETITVNTESYFDILRKVSDYWYDAGTQVKRDFGINKDGELFWKSRPLRTVGVETISNLLSYSLKYAILASKNKITILGAASAPYPLDYETLGWTDNLTGWSVSSGTLTLADEAATTPNVPKAGDYWVKCDVDVTTKIGGFKYALNQITTRNINKLNFWHWISMSTADVAKVLLYTDDSNFFITKSGALTETAGVHFNSISIGDGTEYDADENPSGSWELNGTPNWYDINAIGFLFHDEGGGMGDLDIYIDKIWFYPERWRYPTPAEDSTNQTNYGVREAEYMDDSLNSEADCQKRQETLLYQQKDRILRLDFTVPGNENILLGDRLSITLPLDNLTAQSFDIASVTHSFNQEPNGYQITVHSLNTANTRRLPPLTPLDSIRLNLKGTRDVVSDIYNRVIR